MQLEGTFPSEACFSSKTFRVDEWIDCDCCVSSIMSTSQSQCFEENRSSSWYTSPLQNLHSFVSIPRGCDWLEIHENSLGSCSTYGTLMNSEEKMAIKSCCYCNQCSDYAGYLDSYSPGYPCSWYDANEIYGCPSFGSDKNGDGIAPNDACCWCGGGYSYGDVPTHENCDDSKDWQSISGETCGSLDITDVAYCETLVDESGVLASQSCCFCGGGIQPTPTPSFSDLPSLASPILNNNCTDLEGWVDWYLKSCTWYEEDDRKDCPDHGATLGSYGYTANEACCWCGGGSRFVSPSLEQSLSRSPSYGDCINYEGWVDIF